MMQSSRARHIVSISVIAVSALIFAAAGYLVDGRLVRVLDARLGEALVSQARTIAADLTIPSKNDPYGLALLYSNLSTARIASGAQLIVVCDDLGNVVAADPASLGDESYLRLDNSALASALTGDAAYGERYRVGDLDLKSAFAPVTGPFGNVVGTVGIEAPADYFGALRDVRLALTSTLAVGMLLVIGLTLVVRRFWARSERSERAMFHAQQLATIGQMTATMAHEVRNPLSIIRATAERIRRKHGDGSELFDFIPEEVDRLDRLTRWYLDFARPSDAQPEPVDLVPLIDESVARLRKEIERAGIAVATPDADTQHRFVIADRDRLTQALLNVLLNAVEAMPGGGRIEVRLSGRGSYVRLEIADTGPGIPADRRDAVFDPFFTTKTTGSGLGLAVVRQVAESVGGSAGVESFEGEGTTVWIALPKGE